MKFYKKYSLHNIVIAVINNECILVSVGLTQKNYKKAFLKRVHRTVIVVWRLKLYSFRLLFATMSLNNERLKN